jgi:hypothetical protein
MIIEYRVRLLLCIPALGAYRGTQEPMVSKARENPPFPLRADGRKSLVVKVPPV